MKAFYINLARRVDNQNYLYLRKHMNQLNTGEYICFASHLTLWQKLNYNDPLVISEMKDISLFTY